MCPLLPTQGGKSTALILRLLKLQEAGWANKPHACRKHQKTAWSPEAKVRLPAFILELALELWCPWPLPSFILLNTQRRGTTGLSTGSEYLVLV